ncbi:hypothetical protein T492DRAFT_590157 [Pavlovales sp. CCMP2436]|nr:hypothetical protein T492DRAFT_590157 [Pavlovales sp. CCMP2436]
MQATRSAAIASLVYKLVPKLCSEAEFWRAYWCHIHSALVASGLERKPGFTRETLLSQDDTTTNAIIATFEAYEPFLAFSQTEMDGIVSRDAEDDEKLTAGIKLAITKGVLAADPSVEPVTVIDVLGKSASEVAELIVDVLGESAASGCVLVLQGLSGTGKGTTVDRVKSMLPNAVTWSNGNVFRALTLLATKRCAELGLETNADGKYDMSTVLTPTVLAECVGSLEFGKYNDSWDIHIGGGVDILVSECANTLLKEAVIGKHLPTVAEQTQGEVVSFASAAATKMGSGGQVVLMEGRAPTLEYVRTPFRFELTMSDPACIGMRRAAQRMMAKAVESLRPLPDSEEPVIVAALLKGLSECAK